MCAATTTTRSRVRHALGTGSLRATLVVAMALAAASCGSPERSGASFCRQLGEELPGIGQKMVTSRDVEAMIGRWERLLERAPLTIEGDMAVVTDLFRTAAAVDPADPVEVQDLADASYAANQAAEAVREWVQSTCAVDVATGLTIAPPRTAPPTTIPASTVPATTEPAATVPATTAPSVPAPATTAPATTVAPTVAP